MIYRLARGFAWFAFGVFLAYAWMVPAGAETIAATQGAAAPWPSWQAPGGTWSGTESGSHQQARTGYYAATGAQGWQIGGSYSTTPPSCTWNPQIHGEACWSTLRLNATEMGNGGSGWSYQIHRYWNCTQGVLTLSGGQYICQGATGYSCPSGQNWTLSGSQCTRPDCTSGQVRNLSNGLCIQACTVAENEEVGYVEAQSLPSGTKGCLKGCQVYQGGTVYTDSGGKRVTGAYSYGTPCTGAVAPLADQPTTECYKQGMCAGTVNNATVCVPCNKTESKSTSTTTTPAAGGNPETVKTTTKIETCTGAGACSTTTTTSTSTGGGAAVAGPSTTSTTPDGKASGAARADGQGGFDLDLPDDYAREQTAGAIADAAEKIRDSVDLTYGADASAVQNADADDATKQARTDQDKEVMDRIDGTVDVAAAQKSVWQQAMQGGFLGSIAMTGCQPYSVTISGRTWTLNHCPIAAQISEILGYTLWVGLAIGGFVFMTGGRSAGVS